METWQLWSRQKRRNRQTDRQRGNASHFYLRRCGAKRPMASTFQKFLDHTQRRITAGRTTLDEWSARLTDFYLTTHNIHYRQTSKLLVEFEPAIPASERPQTDVLDRAATGIVTHDISVLNLCRMINEYRFLERGSPFCCRYTCGPLAPKPYGHIWGWETSESLLGMRPLRISSLYPQKTHCPLYSELKHVP